MQKLGKFLSQAYPGRTAQAKSHPQKAPDDQSIFFVCQKIITRQFGERGATNLKPRYYKDKKLFIAARTSLWANELSLNRKAILEALNAELEQTAVEEIKVQNWFGS